MYYFRIKLFDYSNRYIFFGYGNLRGEEDRERKKNETFKENVKDNGFR